MSDSENDDFTAGFDVLPSGDKYHNQWEALGAWFLGPKAENGELLQRMVTKAVQGCIEFRRDYFPQDSEYITEQIKSSGPYTAEVNQLETELGKIIQDLQRTIPFYSTRYMGHMNWDTSLPSNIGYITGLLYNQNNVASEGGPTTTLMEIEVGVQFCEMLGYNTDPKSQKPVGWGHITCGGTVANIEAAWAARNLKFFPLAVRNAIRNEPELSRAKNFQVKLLRDNKKQYDILEVTDWDLLNLDIDDHISMGAEVTEMAGVPTSVFDDLVGKYTVQSIGLHEFLKTNNISESPIAITPASNHYSWPKSMTVLGLGCSNLKGVILDVNGRQDLNHLREILEDCLQRKVPVIMVVAIMGTTEEGAIDPLADILMLRREFQKKGLNFVVHADAAWGGYLCTMLQREEHAENHAFSRRMTVLKKKQATEYVVTTPLNEHSKTQLLALSETDSITVDPHKTGLIPYPAGGLCYRNGSMRGFVTLVAPVVFHGDSDPNIGVFGIEGSKPGAAAVSTLLSHRVIGLDMMGYGRIMAQCMTGARMYYCLWTCIAQDTDNFVCAPIRPLPEDISVENGKRFMRSKILNKPFLEMVQDQTAMNFLSEIGPDALVNSFAINIRGNTDVLLANKLTYLVFKRLSYTSSLRNNHHRIPMYITQTIRDEVMGKEALNAYKARTGLPSGPEPFSMLISTCMNPWETGGHHVSCISSMFREVVYNSIGELTDEPHHHAFVSVSLVSKEEHTFYADYCSVFSTKERQYQAIVKFKILNKNDAERVRQEQDRLQGIKKGPMIVGNKDIMTLGALVNSDNRRIQLDFFSGQPDKSNKPFCSTAVVVEDLVKFRHLKANDEKLIETNRYWMFGDNSGTFLTHYMAREPCFQQVIQLDSRPEHVCPVLAGLGCMVRLTNCSSDEPLVLGEYQAQFVGTGGKMFNTTLVMKNSEAVLFLDTEGPNKEVGFKKEEDMDTKQLEQYVLYDKESLKVIRSMEDKDMYMEGNKDKTAPAQPGDVVASKQFPSLTFDVDIVLPNKRAFGVRDKGGKRALIYYDNVKLIMNK